MPLRDLARQLFQNALARVALPAVLHHRLQRTGSVLSLNGLSYDLTRFSRIALVAVGKAAVPIAYTLQNLCDPLPSGVTLEGLVVSPLPPPHPDPRLAYLPGAHPLPTPASLLAAQQVERLLTRCDSRTLVFFLISGGASAMLERPLDPTVSLHDLIDFYRVLVHSGLGIADMNTLRKHLSAVKGGRLATAGPFTHATLLVSDVPPGAPEVIGSGPSLPDPSTLARCRELLATSLVDAPIPASVRDFFASPTCPETPKPGHPAFTRGAHTVLLSSQDLCAATAEATRRAGFLPVIDNRCDEWHYRDAATYLLNRLRSLTAQSAAPVCLISAGELAVPLPPEHGLGGRNQQFALECASQLQTEPLPHRQIAILSAGTDGIDGNSPAAGAVVDETTATRAAALGLSLPESLARCDAYPLLAALGDTLETGPSGNNLRDLRLLLSAPDRWSPPEPL